MRKCCFAFSIALLLLACTENNPVVHDLVITNATVLNTITGKTETNKTIVIDSGTISDVLDASIEVKADSVIDAQQKLVVPGFIDAVGHLDDIFGDRPDTLNKLTGSIPACVKIFSDTYLPYGVTTVRNSGDGTGYYALDEYFYQNRTPMAPDFYCSGGSIAGWYDGTPYINHLLVQDSSEAEYWVNALYKTGSINSIKLYCNGAMNYSIFTAALRKARDYNLIVTSQVQNEITIDSALNLGLKNFEHASTLCYQRNLFHFSDDPAFNDTLHKYWNEQEEGARIYPYLEAANFVGKDNPKILATIAHMKANNASMTTSLHFFAQWLGKTWFCSTPKAARFETQHFTDLQKERCLNGYSVLSSYVKHMYDEGIVLTMGTDHKDGGKAVLSEILLLHETGIPMENCIQIATINTAEAIGMGDKYGSIEKGKRANLIMFEKNPLDTPADLLENKVVIKDGIIVHR